MPEESDRQRMRLHPLLRAYAARDLATWSAEARAAADSAIAVHYAGYVNTTADAALVPDEGTSPVRLNGHTSARRTKRYGTFAVG